jgi:hypothetical protein
MNIDPSKFTTLRKRSSMKPNLFPDGMTYEEYIQSKNKKLQWDTKAEEFEVVPSAEGENSKTEIPTQEVVMIY